MVAPNTLVGKIDMWLQARGQGMWPRQLPLVEQSKCVGWLLFSAPEYDRKELHKQLYQATGVSVALQFRSIQNSLTDRAIMIAPDIKATHLEIDQSKSRDRWQHLFQMFSLKSQTFPLGIKMRLVAETGLLSTLKAISDLPSPLFERLSNMHSLSTTALRIQQMANTSNFEEIPLN